MPALNQTNCIYCGSGKLQPWLSGIRDRLCCAPGEWGFRRCTECHAALLYPVPTETELISYYPAVYSFAVELGRAGWFRRWLSRVEFRLIYQRMYDRDAKRVASRTAGGEAKGKKLLDVGCGRGLRLLAFRRLGYDVHGWDVQREVVEYVRQELRLPATHSDPEQLDCLFEAESFDLVTAFYVIEHVLDVEELLGRCHRLLKPGGWFVGAVPLADSMQSSIFGRSWSQATEAPRHVTLPTRDGLQRILLTLGFSEIVFTPDTPQICAQALALSVLPGSSTNALYAERRLRAILARVFGIGLAALATPWCWFENRILDRPALAVVFARKGSGGRVESPGLEP